MTDALGRLGVDLERYEVPDKVGGKKVEKSVQRFNQILQELGAVRPYKQPFAVTIVVGDLKGNGDVAAGAKLAAALKRFYAGIEEWRDVSVRLYLAKVKNLEKQPEEADKVKALARSLMADSGAVLEHDVGEEALQVPEVSFAYPVGGVGGDFTVTQYGHDQLARTKGVYGSGPGFGALGVLPVSPQQQKAAVVNAAEGESPVMKRVKTLQDELGLESIHFGYFSIYDERPKEFAKKAVEASPGNAVGVVFAKSADRLDSMSASLVADGHTVKTVELNRDYEVAKESDWVEPKPKKESKKKPPKGKVEPEKPKKRVCLIDFPFGVPNLDMLSLYYASEAPVGATGDQSFIEAYTMRGLKNEQVGKKEKPTPDVLYDVTPQQTGLYRQLGELSGKTLDPDKGVQQGLKPIHVDEAVQEAIATKNLLYPIVMLINKTLDERE